MAENSSFGALPGLRFFHRQRATESGAAPPRCQLAWRRCILLAGGAVAGAQPLQVEPRMAFEKLDEMLAHHAGGAEDAYFDLLSVCIIA